ncbi:type II toxin-antitoxin system ParD family antitoxin [Falsiroseomonas sp. E2-1-a20]|uniref:type II toxin-antitoxin system ParD family antitoxin n=1 Tax=Falsiroseomonas sp. E2-1-a20 TaxID=3239300 RepID=UPI003F370396
MTDRPSSLNVSLTRELAEYVGDRVRSGRYRSASEVVRTALRLLQREEPGSTGAEPKDARRVPAAPDGHG